MSIICVYPLFHLKLFQMMHYSIMKEGNILLWYDCIPPPPLFIFCTFFFSLKWIYLETELLYSFDVLLFLQIILCHLVAECWS